MCTIEPDKRLVPEPLPNLYAQLLDKKIRALPDVRTLV
ncbi:hypothetical protein ALP58_102113 [Pseudomonas savastanoi]|uniref:Uncharacterized protein n=2 Tax=Pseudomonas syringae group TaxID=136849 RepID=A0A0P9NT73_PSESX|nr:hypothetical protein ALO79_100535 [Pseudomonas syringae pv. castaneae]RMS83923.1 hypothetical protein ALP58_102113 [Pseudomonas savastanoi]